MNSRSLVVGFAVAMAISLCGLTQSVPLGHAAVVGNDLTLTPDSWGVNTILTQRRNPDVSGSAYTGFAFGGVLTSVSVKTQGDAGSIDVYVLRKTTAPTPTTQNFLSLAPVIPIDVPEYLPGAGTITTVPTRLSVQPGDQFGASAPVSGTRYLHWHNAGGPTDYCFFKNGSQVAGADATYDSALCNNYIPLVRGTVESDVDGDGYGDETQDLCPTDVSRQTACEIVAPDLKLSQRRVTSKRRTTSATRTLSIGNVGGSSAERVVLSLSSSRKLKSLKILKGKCIVARNGRSCTIASIAPNETVSVKLRAVTRRARSVTLKATVKSVPPDSIVANNSLNFALKFKPKS